MLLKKLVFVVILALFASGSSSAWAKDRGGKGNGKAKAQKYEERRDREDRYYGKRDSYRDDDRDDRDRDGWGDRDVRDRMRYQGIDKNRDGFITRREWPGNDQSFRQHDRNGDGVLSGSELREDSRRLKRDRDDSRDLPDFVRRR